MQKPENDKGISTRIPATVAERFATEANNNGRTLSGHLRYLIVKSVTPAESKQR